MINTYVTAHLRTPGKLCLDAAAGRLGGIIWEQDFPKLAVFIASTGASEQYRLFFPMPEIFGRHKAAPPKSFHILLCTSLFLFESAPGIWLKIQRQTLLNEHLVQAHRLASNGTNSYVSLVVRFVTSQIFAFYVALPNQLDQLVA